MLTTDHTFIHKWNEPYLPVFPSHTAYSTSRPTENRRLSLPTWLVTYQGGLPVSRWSPISVLTRSDIQTPLMWPLANTITAKSNCQSSGYDNVMSTVGSTIARSEETEDNSQSTGPITDRPHLSFDTHPPGYSWNGC